MFSKFGMFLNALIWYANCGIFWYVLVYIDMFLVCLAYLIYFLYMVLVCLVYYNIIYIWYVFKYIGKFWKLWYTLISLVYFGVLGIFGIYLVGHIVMFWYILEYFTLLDILQNVWYVFSRLWYICYVLVCSECFGIFSEIWYFWIAYYAIFDMFCHVSCSIYQNACLNLENRTGGTTDASPLEEYMLLGVSCVRADNVWNTL